MAQVTDEMASEYERIYSRAASDPGTAGDEGEENWANVLKDWLPPQYHVETKGRLIGFDGRLSPQVDVLVLKPSYPRKLREKKIWIADGVAAAFECKNTVTAVHVTEAVRRCADFKALFPQREGSPLLELRSPLIFGLLAHSHTWKSPKSEPLLNIQNSLNAARKDVSHPRFEIDIICVSDLATWFSTYITRYEAAWNPAGREVLQEAFGGVCGPMTSMICHSPSSHDQKPSFRPVGSFLNQLTQRLASADASIRDFADYYRLVDLGGSGSGDLRPWPLSSYSVGVAQQIANGRCTNGVFWDEWSVGGF